MKRYNIILKHLSRALIAFTVMVSCAVSTQAIAAKRTKLVEKDLKKTSTRSTTKKHSSISNKKLSQQHSSPKPATTHVATTPQPSQTNTKSDSLAADAAQDFSQGGKGVGSGFVKGAKVTGHAFKKAGVTVGKGFKKAGNSIKDYFTGKKEGDEIQENTLKSNAPASNPQGRDLAKDNRPAAPVLLDAVGNDV